jgi:AcrR family transcriptional regulator
MESRKVDHRIRYTKEILRRSLLELMKTDPIGSLTITALCRLAGINRGTFYKHYADPFALLAEIQNELFDDIRKSVADKSTLGAVSALEGVLNVISENAEIFSVVVGENGDKDFMKKLMNIAFEAFRAKYRIDEERIRLVYAYASSGVAGAIQCWISTAPRLSVQEVAQIIDGIMELGMKGVAVFTSP